MNRFTRLVFFCFALVCAFAVSFVVYKRLNAPSAPVSGPAAPATTGIAVAVKDLGRGVLLGAADIKMVPYLQQSLPPGHFVAADKLVGRVVLTPVVASQPLLESNLAPKEITKGGMASVVKHQKRAMAIKVDEVIGVAGFIQPGHLVDVLVALDTKDEAIGQVTKTVLENIPVLSIGTQDQETEEKKAKKVTVVTLEVSLEEGERLALAVNEGRIQLALRNYTDLQPVLTGGATVEELLASYTSVSSIPAPVAAPPDFKPIPKQERPETVVEVMNGNKVDKVRLVR